MKEQIEERKKKMSARNDRETERDRERKHSQITEKERLDERNDNVGRVPIN